MKRWMTPSNCDSVPFFVFGRNEEGKENPKWIRKEWIMDEVTFIFVSIEQRERERRREWKREHLFLPLSFPCFSSRIVRKNVCQIRLHSFPLWSLWQMFLAYLHILEKELKKTHFFKAPFYLLLYRIFPSLNMLILFPHPLRIILPTSRIFSLYPLSILSFFLSILFPFSFSFYSLSHYFSEVLS